MASKYNLFIIVLLFSICCNAAFAEPTYVYCNEDAKINDTRTSKNIDNLLAKLVNTTVQNGFSTASIGKAKDQVHGLALCRADVSKDDCSTCIKDAAMEIRKRCPDDADARLWNEFEYCFLRYDTDKFFGQVDTSNGIIYFNTENVTDPENFNKKLKSLTDTVRKEAVQPGNKGLGKGKTKLSTFTVYALAQSTRGLLQLSCAQCLATAIGNAFPSYCYNKRGCRSIYSSCYVRYELYPFFFPRNPDQTLGNASAKYYSSLVNHLKL